MRVVVTLRNQGYKQLMKNRRFIEDLLHSQGLAVFTYLGEGKFRRIGRFPTWFLEIGGAKTTRDGTVQLGKRFPFVQNFLSDAEEAWKTESKETKHSGVWIEGGIAGREIAIEASALWTLGMRVLLLRNPQEAYQDQKRWLQTARESRLKHDRLDREIQKKEILLHCIIHDLSQPLSAMRGCFSCLKLGNSPNEERNFVEIGLKQSGIQEAMIHEILDVFSEEFATPAVFRRKEAEAPNIAACALEVVTDYAAAFAENGVRIELDHDADLSADWKVVGDESRLRRVFANLVENSLRLSPPKSTVVLGVIDENQFVRAFVDDEGPGFPGGRPSMPQFSLFGKNKEHGGKAGLGLYFCRITVEQWGGSIGCEQRREGGARFWFRLPRAERERITIAPPEQTVAVDGRGQHRTQPGGFSVRTNPRAQQNAAGKAVEVVWHPLRVLLAEDTTVNAELTARMLESRGHEVARVENGRKVLSALENKKFDLILMDQEMPELNGTETTRMIRQKERETGQHVPIVGVTGMALRDGGDLCLAAGMDACLAKPYQVDELYEIVEGLFFAPGTKPPDGKPRSDSKVLDETPLAFLGEKFVHRLRGVFLTDSSKKLSEIRRAILRQDAERLASLAHTLGGSAGFFDAKRLVVASRRLESMGRSADFRGVHAAYASLKREWSLLRLRLRELAPQSARRNNKRRRMRSRRSGRKGAERRGAIM